MYSGHFDFDVASFATYIYVSWVSTLPELIIWIGSMKKILKYIAVKDRINKYGYVPSFDWLNEIYIFLFLVKVRQKHNENVILRNVLLNEIEK